MLKKLFLDGIRLRISYQTVSTNVRTLMISFAVYTTSLITTH